MADQDLYGPEDEEDDEESERGPRVALEDEEEAPVRVASPLGHEQPPAVASPSATAPQTNAPAVAGPSSQSGSPVAPAASGGVASPLAVPPVPKVAPVSQKHGVGGGLLKALDIAGSILVPGVAANIPGSTLNTRLENERAEKGYEQQVGDQQKQAQTGLTNEQTQEGAARIPLINAQANEANAKAQEAANPAAKPVSGAALAQLAKLGYKPDGKGGVVAMDDSEISPEVKAVRSLAEASENLKKAETDLANSKNDPNSAAYKLEKARVAAERERVGQAAQTLGLHQQELDQRVQQQQFQQSKPYQSILDTQQKAHGAADRMAQGDAEAGNELILQFVNAIKPESGFRLTQTEWNNILKARGLGGDVTAFVQKIQSGVALTPEQSHEMLAAIDDAAAIAHRHLNEIQQTAPKTAQPAGGQGFKVPDGAPVAPKEDGKILKQHGKAIATSKGGQWAPLPSQ